MHANELAAELSVATLISCGTKSYYVCVTPVQKYLLSFNKVPVCLREIVGNLREWHLQKLGCLPEDVLGRRKRAMAPSVEKYKNKLYDLTEDTLGFEEVDRINFSSRKSTRAEMNGILGGDEQVIVEEDDNGVSRVTVSRCILRWRDVRFKSSLQWIWKTWGTVRSRC